ncbi:MAG: DUF302 domain-containing protein [Gammaproteobacteria bacterium]|jgi:uncharacterized protein (DUF302 family)
MYSFSVDLKASFDEAIDKVTAALKDEGFGVLTDIDFAGTIKKKLDIDRPAYRILGACNPPLANQAVNADINAGVLLPCNVVVRDNEDGSCSVVFMDPMAVINLSDNEDVAKVAHEANDRLQRVKVALQS